MPKASTPAFTPENKAGAGSILLGILLNVLPWLDEQAKAQISQLALTGGIVAPLSGAAVRIGRQKWWKNFAVDDDNDPATPPVPVWRVPTVRLYALTITTAAAAVSELGVIAYLLIR